MSHCQRVDKNIQTSLTPPPQPQTHLCMGSHDGEPGVHERNRRHGGGMINLTLALSFSTLTGNGRQGVNAWSDGWRRRSVTRQTQPGTGVIIAATQEERLIHMHTCHNVNIQSSRRVLNPPQQSLHNDVKWAPSRKHRLCVVDADNVKITFLHHERIMWQQHELDTPFSRVCHVERLIMIMFIRWELGLGSFN